MLTYKKNHTTPTSDSTNVDPVAASFPTEQTFHQHLRELICGATSIVLKEIIETARNPPCPSECVLRAWEAILRSFSLKGNAVSDWKRKVYLFPSARLYPIISSRTAA
jgi:hypothetical protein